MKKINQITVYIYVVKNLKKKKTSQMEIVLCVKGVRA